MGRWFNENLMNTNWSLSEKVRARKLHNQVVEMKAKSRAERLANPPLTALEIKRKEAAEKVDKIRLVDEVIATCFDEFGDLLPDVNGQRTLFRLDISTGKVEVRRQVMVSTPDLMRHYLMSGWKLEHPLGYVAVPGSPYDTYVPPEAEAFTCEECGKPFKSKIALGGHVGSAHRKGRNKKRGGVNADHS